MTQNAPPDRNRGLVRRILVAVSIAAVGLAVVLYAIEASHRKETQTLGASAACPGAREAALRLEPLVHGEIAALSISTQPRPLPELKFTAGDGKQAVLTDFKGRIVLLNLWATWCVPCRQEMPGLDRLQAELGLKDFVVVAVNIDTARLERPKAFLTEVGVKNLAFYADNTADIFQVLKGAGKAIGLPTTILVSQDGCDLGVMAGPAQWDSPEALALLKAAKG
jgi:thiol-disulfide isomerase/thioredoxin